jgi:DNA-binding IclR family transcriptional regulator
MESGTKGLSPADSPPFRLRRPDDRVSLSRTATRALDILEYFGQVKRPLRAIDIVRALNLHPSTTNQLLKTLVGSAHLVFDARSKTYLPAPRLADFSGWMVEQYGADNRFRMMLQQIRAETGAVVSLSTPNDIYMQVLDLLVPQDAPIVSGRGMQVSLFGSAAIGSAYLSILRVSEIESLSFRARLKREQFREILAVISQIRDGGCAHGPTSDGKMHAIAIPLPISGTPIPLVVALAGRAEAVRAHRPELQDALQRSVSYWLGLRAPILDCAARAAENYVLE